MPKHLPVAFCVVLVATGCGSKLHDERMITLGIGEEKPLQLEPVRREQKIRVHFQSPGVPVTVSCFLEKDQPDVEKARLGGKVSDKVLGSQEKKEEAEFEATIPANQQAIVLISSAARQEAKVKIKITNR